MKIYKYPLKNVLTTQELDLPRSARVLTFGMQNGKPVIWATVDETPIKEKRTFVIAPTGGGIPDWNTHYVGTAFDGPFVWHLFELKA